MEPEQSFERPVHGGGHRLHLADVCRMTAVRASAFADARRAGVERRLHCRLRSLAVHFPTNGAPRHLPLRP